MAHKLGLMAEAHPCTSKYKKTLLEQSNYLNKTNLGGADIMTEAEKLAEMARIQGKRSKMTGSPMRKQ